MPEVDNEFYVGYAATPPPGLARRLRLTVFGLLAAALVIAGLLAGGQSPFDDSRFEFLQLQTYQGTVLEWPYPALLSGGKAYLLAGEGKHGAGSVVSGLHAKSAILRGALIENGENRMLELPGNSVTGGTGQPHSLAGLVSHGSVKLAGEIVDTKCYFGVMNPGRGKVHRDCAVRCISGGIPPGLRVPDSRGQSRVLLLVGPDDRPFGRELLSYVGEPVAVTGELMSMDSLWFLKTDLDAFRRE